MAVMNPCYKRKYVKVDVIFDEAGRMLPRTLIWPNGKCYEIDRVLDIRPAHAEKAGGQGDRYKIRLRGQEREIFFEHNPDISAMNIGRWFVEVPG